MESFSLFLQILEDFQTHLRGTFFYIFWNKGYYLKYKNLSYKSNPNLISKHYFLFFKNDAEKKLYYMEWGRSIILWISVYHVNGQVSTIHFLMNLRIMHLCTFFHDTKQSKEEAIDLIESQNRVSCRSAASNLCGIAQWSRYVWRGDKTVPPKGSGWNFHNFCIC